MSDGDGAAFGDLAFEDGDDAAGGAKDVAEADGDEFGLAGVGFGEGLEVNLGEAFAGAHDAGGVDGFVGRDQDEACDVMFEGEPGQAGGGNRVVLDRLAGLRFHHAHVFMGGGVEQDRRLMLAKHGNHAGAVQDIGNDGHD